MRSRVLLGLSLALALPFPLLCMIQLPGSYVLLAVAVICVIIAVLSASTLLLWLVRHFIGNYREEHVMIARRLSRVIVILWIAIASMVIAFVGLYFTR